MRLFNEYLEKFLVWESRPVTFDKGYALLLTVTFILALVK